MNSAALGKFHYFEVGQSHGIYYGNDHAQRTRLILEGVGLNASSKVFYIVTHGEEGTIEIRLPDEDFRPHTATEFNKLAGRLKLHERGYEAVVVTACEAGVEFVPELSGLWPNVGSKKPVFFGFEGLIDTREISHPEFELDRFDSEIFSKPIVAYNGQDVDLTSAEDQTSHALQLLGQPVLDRVANLLSNQLRSDSDFKCHTVNGCTAQSFPGDLVLNPAPLADGPARLSM